MTSFHCMPNSPVICSVEAADRAEVAGLTRQNRPPATLVSTLQKGLILLRRCQVVPITAEVTLRAMYVGERHQISHWDALIVPATPFVPKTCRMDKYSRDV